MCVWGKECIDMEVVPSAPFISANVYMVLEVHIINRQLRFLFSASPFTLM